jgi:predicted nucleic acid-binding protein
MIILDTNVLSGPMKGGANPAVAAWLDQQDIETLYLTTINLAELLPLSPAPIGVGGEVKRNHRPLCWSADSPI